VIDITGVTPHPPRSTDAEIERGLRIVV
jgi:hypothetical protein